MGHASYGEPQASLKKQKVKFFEGNEGEGCFEEKFIGEEQDCS